MNVNAMTKPAYLLAVVFSTSLLCGLISLKTILATASIGGLLIAVPLYLINAKKLPQHSSERVRLFLEKTNGGPIAHRGGQPENTLAAIRKSKIEGASGMEVDLAITKDGHAVLLHDHTVDRTSNGTGRIEELTLEEVKQMDFGYHCGVQFVNERIPTLKEAVSLCKELELVMFIELKSSTTDIPRAVEVIIELFSDNPWMYDCVAVVSFFPSILYKLRSADPDIISGFNFVTGYLILSPDGIYEGKPWWKYLLSPLADRLMFWSLELWILKLLGVKLLLPNKETLLRKWVDVKKLEEKGMCVVPWTVNERKEVEHFRDVLKLPYVTDFVSLNEN